MSITRNIRFATCPELTDDALRSVLEGDDLALVVPGFCDIDTARVMASSFTDGRSEAYHHEHRDSSSAVAYQYYGVDRIGFPFNLTLGGDEANRERYRREALPGIRRVRSLCSPRLSPIDKLRLELDEVWPSGCQIASFTGSKMFVGIARLMRAEVSALSEESPHFDQLPSEVHQFDKMLAANIYLSVPSSGGELEIWNVPGEEGLGRSQLGRPLITVRPALGDLILFNVRYMHAVRRFQSGVRMSIQCFVGYRREDPILLWN